MRKILLVSVLLFMASNIFAQELPLLKVSKDRHYIETVNNEPFFWLGGTAWEMLHRLNREEVDLYLKDRADKGFTIIQTVILAELKGLDVPNAYGELPLIDKNPAKINEAYFEHVDYVIKKAHDLGLYIGLLPTWGDKFNLKWGPGPEIFTPENAEIYGEFVAKRYLNNNNIVWVLGGDRIPEKEAHFEIIRAMARGIRKIDSRHLITYHPSGLDLASDWFNDEWLDIDMFQTTHMRQSDDYRYVAESRENTPARPVINGEARYENIQDHYWKAGEHDWMDDSDVRVCAYWSMLAGAAGYTYGCNDIWQMYRMGEVPICFPRTGWEEALHLPGARQMMYMKNFLSRFPWQEMSNAQSLILNENPKDSTYVVCSMGSKKDFLIAYTPWGEPIQPDLSKLNAQKVNAYWFNPRSGKSLKIGEYKTSDLPEFKPWVRRRGSDFVLVIMDVNSNYPFPE